MSSTATAWDRRPQLSIGAISVREVPARADELAAVYAEAFARPPYSKERLASAIQLRETLQQHRLRRGFRMRAAVDGGRIVGLAYGYTSAAGQWWHDLVADALGLEGARRWLSDCFELVELAVLPAFQGRRLGSRLHDSVLEGLRHRTAALSTRQEETAARRLYRRRGWVDLVRHFSFQAQSPPYLIMGLDLRRFKVALAGRRD